MYIILKMSPYCTQSQNVPEEAGRNSSWETAVQKEKKWSWNRCRHHHHHHHHPIRFVSPFWGWIAALTSTAAQPRRSQGEPRLPLWLPMSLAQKEETLRRKTGILAGLFPNYSTVTSLMKLYSPLHHGSRVTRWIVGGPGSISMLVDSMQNLETTFLGIKRKFQRGIASLSYFMEYLNVSTYLYTVYIYIYMYT